MTALFKHYMDIVFVTYLRLNIRRNLRIIFINFYNLRLYSKSGIKIYVTLKY